MSYIYDTQPIIEVMRRKTVATVESIKATLLKREPTVRPNRLEYTVRALSVKHGGPFGHKDR